MAAEQMNEAGRDSEYTSALVPCLVRPRFLRHNRSNSSKNGESIRNQKDNRLSTVTDFFM